MSKKVTVVIILALFLSTTALAVEPAEADPYPMPGVMVTIKNSQNTTFTEDPIKIEFRAVEVHFRSHVNFSYSLDDCEAIAITNVSIITEDMRSLYADVVYFKEMEGEIPLDNLPNGWHNITVYCQANEQEPDPTYLFGTYEDKATIDFQVAIPANSTSTVPSPTVPELTCTLLIVFIFGTITAITLLLKRKASPIRQVKSQRSF